MKSEDFLRKRDEDGLEDGRIIEYRECVLCVTVKWQL